MKDLSSNIRQNKKLRKILLAQVGGIMKYWAEHPNNDFDIDLFDAYESQIVDAFLLDNNQNRGVRFMPKDELRYKSLKWYHDSKGSELKFFVAMKPALNAIDEKLSEQVLNHIDIYMVDAYKESRRFKYPDGISAQDFYEKVIRAYSPMGLALDSLERVLQEYRGEVVQITGKNFILENIIHPGESSEWKEVNNLQLDFNLRMFINTFLADGGNKKLRQAVREMINNDTQNLNEQECRIRCRELAKDEIRKVNQFTKWVNNESYPMKKLEDGKLVQLITPEERHWLQNIMYDNTPGETGTQELTPMDRYFCSFLSILENIGRFWAAQLLVHGIDMKELEKETGIILSRNTGFLYYVDNEIDDHRGDCCIYNWDEAKKLLRKIHGRFKEITWEDEKRCFKSAVLHVMEMKQDEDGEYIFNKNTQWIAVYRFAIDKGIMYDVDDPRTPNDPNEPQYTIFEKFVHELQLNENPSTRIPFTKNAINCISKDNYIRYNEKYPWPTDGLNDPRSLLLYAELEGVYQELKKDYNKLISQKQESWL